MSTFRVVILRACHIRGIAVAPGSVLDLSSADAQELLSSMRGELADAADAVALREAQAEEFRVVSAASPVVGQSVSAAIEQVKDIEQQWRPKNPIGFIWPAN